MWVWRYWFHKESLKYIGKAPPEPDIYDRVRFIGMSVMVGPGAEGEIVEITTHSNKPTQYLVRFDDDENTHWCSVWTLERIPGAKL